MALTSPRWAPGRAGPHGGINPNEGKPLPPISTHPPLGSGTSQYGASTGINPSGKGLPPPSSAPNYGAATPNAPAPPQPGMPPPVAATSVPNTLPNAGTQAPTAAPAAGQPWYNQGDIDWFQQMAQSRYGRQATAEELAKVGANSTSRDSAQAYADTLARQQGWAGPAGAPAAPTGAAADNQALLQKRIQELLSTQTGDVNTGSQEYQGQLGSFKRGQQSQLERAKRAAATRAAGTGQAANMEQIDLAAAQQGGDFEAGLAGQQIMRQREDLQNAMQLAQQSGLAGEARALQEKLAQSDIELRRYLGKGQLGLGMLGTLLGNQRAQDALGFNYAQLGNQVNQQTLQQLLGGL